MPDLSDAQLLAEVRRYVSGADVQDADDRIEEMCSRYESLLARDTALRDAVDMVICEETDGDVCARCARTVEDCRADTLYECSIGALRRASPEGTLADSEAPDQDDFPEAVQ